MIEGAHAETRAPGIPGIFLGAPHGAGFENPLLAFPDLALDSPGSYVVPFLSYWAAPWSRLEEIRRGFTGSPDLDNGEMCFQFPFASSGPNRASFTDLMVLSKKAAVAFEAKWTEPMLESIGIWRPSRSPADASAILDSWFSAIAGRTRSPSTWQPGDDDLVYQCLHRLASLCSTGKKELHLVYQLFGGWHDREYHAALSRLAERVLAKGKMTVSIQTVAVSLSPELERLREDWKDLPPVFRVDALRELILHEKAVHFGDERWTTIC